MEWGRPNTRSNVIAHDGIVASSHPIATQSGLEILKKGGNAVDAAVAVAAVLDVVEPFSTGCGGDAFILIHQSGSSRPLSYNGSGRSGSLVTLQEILDLGWTSMPIRGGAPVTVPGALHLWCHVIEKHGTLEMKDVLAPAIHYARHGFPVSQSIAKSWPRVLGILQNDAAREIYAPNGQTPSAGQIARNPDLAKTFESVTEEGPEVFYSGKIAESIVNTVQQHGGFLTMEDMARHTTTMTEPISVSYRGTDVFEHPPNGQGFAALAMLNIMETYDFSKLRPLSSERYHLMIESKKLAYADLHQHNADPSFYEVPIQELISKSYARERAQLIDLNHAMSAYHPGLALGQDTVYFATADREGNAVSFINSLYMGIGSGLVAPGTGVKLQNRGHLFSLDPKHPNSYAPRKLPFHTIIPGALYKDGMFMGVFGIMGGAHQAQAHAQFVSNLVDYGMGPQDALDYPRFNHNQVSNEVGFECDINSELVSGLEKRGHSIIEEATSSFGCGQAILVHKDGWIAGSDHRKDGMAAGYTLNV